MAAEERALDAPGWRAIDAALEPVHGKVEPLHWGTIVRWRLGGPDPLDGISAWQVEGPHPHWHLVTYGLSELYEKESEDEARSGWGFELTLRLRRGGEEAPPGWALLFLQNLARYVYESGNPFGPGQKMDLNGPVALGVKTEITAVAFTPDPQVPPCDTPNGRLEFLQVVGITRDELELAQSWDTERLLEELRGTCGPLLVTDLTRPSLLADPARRARVLARAEAEGSSQGSAYVQGLTWEVADEADEEQVHVRLGAIAVGSLRRMLEGRTLHGRKFLLEGDREVVVVEPAREGASWGVDEEVLVLRLDPAAARAMLVDLEPRRGTFSWPELPGLELVVLPTKITGPTGEVIETVG